MDRRSLIYSIASPAVYSGGASLSGYTRLWAPDPFEVTGDLLAGWSEEGPWGQVSYLVSDDLNETTGALQLSPQELVRRLGCQYLVGRLPVEGLLEAWESLKEIYDYYSRPRLTQFPDPQVVTVPVDHGREYRRPTIPIEE